MSNLSKNAHEPRARALRFRSAKKISEALLVFPLNSNFPPRTDADAGGGADTIPRRTHALARRGQRRRRRRRTHFLRTRGGAWGRRILLFRSGQSSVTGVSSGGDANWASSVTPIALRRVRSSIQSFKKGLAGHFGILAQPQCGKVVRSKIVMESLECGFPGVAAASRKAKSLMPCECECVGE